MNRHFKARRGFTMIELLFVIIIMGIVGGMVLEVIRQYYEGIYKTQTYIKRVAQADQILTIMSKYFENAVDISVVNLDQDESDASLDGGECSEPGIESNEATAHDYTIAFVGVDVDSLKVNGLPGWSEQAAGTWINATSQSFIFKDANLSQANAVISALYPASDLQNSAFYNFNGLSAGVDSCESFNWKNNGNNGAYSKISAVDYTTKQVTVTESAGFLSGNDRKYLLRTGYAFRVLDNGDLVMYTNFRPWKSEVYTSGTRITMGQSVASFYADFNNTNSFNDRGSIWRLKICMQGLESNLSTSDVAASAICRERRVRVHY